MAGTIRLGIVYETLIEVVLRENKTKQKNIRNVHREGKEVR